MATTPTGNRRAILRHLDKGVDTSKAEFDRKTGRFLAANGGWAVTNQDCIFPLALLLTEPTSKHYDSKDVLDLIRRGGDALCDWQQPDGTFEFIKPDGSRWGQIYMPWTIYHWAEAWALVHDRLGDSRRERWRDGLIRAYEGVARIIDPPNIHNIPTWHGMSLTRGSQLFDRDEWAAVGKRQIVASVDHQHPHGYWPEGSGPTNGYNGVYIHAIGLYHRFTGDKSVLRSLKRAADFQTTFTYPDGSPVETIDGRQRYHGHAGPMGMPGLMLSPTGRGLVDLRLKSLLSGRGALSPHLASLYQHFGDGDVKDVPQTGKRHRSIFKSKAVTWRSAPWFMCVSAYATPPESRAGNSKNRWIMTRANCLSVWHDKLGLMIGGGNSKHDPQFATFDVWRHGTMQLEPDSATFASERGREIIRMRYGDVTGIVEVKFIGDSGLELAFEVPAASLRRAKVGAAFTIPMSEGDHLAIRSDGKQGVDRDTQLDPLRAEAVGWSHDGGYVNPRVETDKWTLTMPLETSFAWPAYPFNPYAIDNAAPASQAHAHVDIGFEHGRRKVFRFKLKG